MVWKTRNVVAGDELTGMSDLYAKLWMDGCESQKTDTHLRSGSSVLRCTNISILCGDTAEDGMLVVGRSLGPVSPFFSYQR